jgi:hypothetical protein
MLCNVQRLCGFWLPLWYFQALYIYVKHYDKRDYFNYPIVKFPFICSNIPAAPLHMWYTFLSWSDIPKLVVHIRVSLIEGCWTIHYPLECSTSIRILITPLVFSSSSLYLCYEIVSRSWRDVLDTTWCDKVYQWLASGRWCVSPNRHDMF